MLNFYEPGKYYVWEFKCWPGISFKMCFVEAERWLSTTEHLLLLQKIWVWSPAPTWSLTTVTPGPDDCKCSGTNNWPLLEGPQNC